MGTAKKPSAHGCCNKPCSPHCDDKKECKPKKKPESKVVDINGKPSKPGKQPKSMWKPGEKPAKDPDRPRTLKPSKRGIKKEPAPYNKPYRKPVPEPPKEPVCLQTPYLDAFVSYAPMMMKLLLGQNPLSCLGFGGAPCCPHAAAPCGAPPCPPHN